jgi:nucleotide-binding universal stress UspA family protein
MKTILVPTDFSKNAENALQYAINLANKMQAKIILLHSFHIDYTNAGIPADIIEKEVREVQETSNTYLKAIYNRVFHPERTKPDDAANQTTAKLIL